MRWNYDDIAFLHQPDIYTGVFGIGKMQDRHEELKAQKIESLRNAMENEPDPLKAMLKLNKPDHLQFLDNNRQEFENAGKFEEAVLTLYRKGNSPFLAEGTYAVWEKLFAACDPVKLSALGEPFILESATVYRTSIIGTVKGLSWTLSRQQVRKFEERWREYEEGHGVAYAIDIKKENVLIFLRDRREEEVILDPSFIQSAAIRELK